MQKRVQNSQHEGCVTTTASSADVQPYGCYNSDTQLFPRASKTQYEPHLLQLSVCRMLMEKVCCTWARVNLESVPTRNFTETLVLYTGLFNPVQDSCTGKLILCAFRVSVTLVSLYFLITKVLLSKVVKPVCLAIDVLMGWELQNIRLVTQSHLFREQSSLCLLCCLDT